MKLLLFMVSGVVILKSSYSQMILGIFLIFCETLQAQQLPADSQIISAIPARCVGFTDKGRMSALAVYDKNPDTFYVGSANGGVLKTVNGGFSFEFVFDKYGSSNIGAIAVSQKNSKLVWVGTGEPWQRNSVGRGDGVYKSTDGGITWSHMGLKETNTIAKIAIHPSNNEIVFVAAMGSAWGYGSERGIYKTKDGGKTWRKVLYSDDRSSGGEVIIDPIDPNNMLAALWDHVHRPYGWFESGPGSAMYRSIDGGETWKKVVVKGLPTSKIGRIAIDYFPKNPKYVAAIIQQSDPMKWVYTSKDGGQTWEMKKGIHIKSFGEKIDTVKGNIFDGGIVWNRAYYNHFIRYHPKDVNVFYYGGPLHYTFDGGNTWVGSPGDGHGLWMDPTVPEHVISINDNGVQQNRGSVQIVGKMPPLGMLYGIGYDMRKLYWVMGNRQDQFGVMGPTQTMFGHISNPDFLTGLGDEGGKLIADPEDWTKLFSSTRSLALGTIDIITGKTWSSPIRNIVSYSDSSNFNKYIKSEKRYRTGWNPGFSISPWNSNVIYYGGNYLFKSLDHGGTWQEISPDLTHDNLDWQKPDDGYTFHGEPSIEGNSRQYQTIRTVYESPLLKDMVWAGTDCGYVQLTMDGGKTWKNLTSNIPGIPEHCWVSHINPSKFSKGRAYVSFDNHRNNDNNTYVYVTEDFGQSWTSINGNLPKEEACFVIKEGLKNPDLLYLGTEFGLWISLDRGGTWVHYQNFQNNTFPKKHLLSGSSDYFPTVAVHDLEIHPRELDLIVGTHGRGVWILTARPLEEMSKINRSSDVYFGTIGNIYLFNKTRRDQDLLVNLPVMGNTQPGTYLSFYLKEESIQIATFRLVRESSQLLRGAGVLKANEKRVLAKKGLNILYWDKLSTLEPGNYVVIAFINGTEYCQPLEVEDVSEELYPGTKVSTDNIKIEIGERK